LKKRSIILVISLLLLLAAVLFYVEHRRSQQDTVELWSMVPESAALVYESASLPAHWEQLKNNPLWSSLQEVETFRQMDAHMQLIDSLLNLQQFFTSRQLLIGMHVVSKDAFDFSFYFEVDNSRDYNTLVRTLRRFETMEHVQQDSRMFNGFRIHELTDRRSGKQFSYLLHQNIFAGSFTPFLVEDVVRNIKTEFRELSFRHHNASLASVPSLTDDVGNLYLNNAKLPLLLSVFTSNEVLPHLQPLSHLSSATFLDANLGDQQLLFNGISKLPLPAAVGQPQAPYWLATLQEARPQPIALLNYVPERTAMLLHLQVGQGPAWLQRLYALQQQSEDKLARQTLRYRQHLREYHQVDLPDYHTWLGSEIGLLWLESVDVEAPDKVLILQAADTALARQQLNRLENRLKPEGELSYRENFAGYQIGEISYKEYPASLLGPMALGFEQTFYLISERYVVFANSIRALKRLLADREAENTWDKSIQEVRFLEASLDRANVSLFVNTARCWRLLERQLSPAWKQFASQHSSFLKSFDHLAVQFSRSEEDFYTSVAISYRSMEAGGNEREQFRDVSRLFVDHPIRTKPFVVRDHTNQTLEVVFQDEARQFYLAELNGELQWKDSLSGDIVGEVYQIDYFKNGKLQYLFATDSALHILDRNGDYVSGYPSYMPEGVQIRHLSLVDYDNSRNYRFLLSDQQGRLWMFNKDREALDGWNPNQSLSAPPATAPFHVRVGEKDFLLAIQEDGEIYALNRRGQPYAGFPISLSLPVQSGAFTELGSSPAKTEITTVTSQGEVIAFNLSGNITRREQLYRPSSETRFRISVDALGKTYVIVRQDEQLFGVLDRNAKLLFEKNYMSPAALASGMLEVQYYNFGAGNELFAVTDQVQEFTYLFNGQGTLIKDRPIESRFPVGILYFDNEKRFQVFRNFENEFSVLSFSI
jgi:hypothetical protein